jgi:hypothetical protein
MLRKLSFAALAFVVLLVGAFLTSPRCVLWGPASIVQARLLFATPRGTPKGEVVKYLSENRYAVSESSGENRRQVPGYPIPGSFSSYLTADIGHYRVVWRVDIDAIYTFDSEQHLKDIVVRRHVDAP